MKTINRFFYAMIIATFLVSSSFAQETTIRSIEKIAEEQGYGYKIANLCELNELLNHSDLQSQLFNLRCSVRVPTFFGIASSQIVAYLHQNGFDLSSEWNQLIGSLSREEKNEMIRNKRMSMQFAQGLQRFQEKIKTIFHLGTPCEALSTPEWHYFIANESFLIVRSTGLEDKIGLTNAGGNVSIKHVSSALSDTLAAMGEVVASYFSEKSISQRLLSDDTNLFILPLTPVLIQEMVIGSPRPIEAVVHTTEQSGPTPGCTSFNCGYNVVDSQSRSDMYYYFCSGSGHAVLANQVEHLSESCRLAIKIVAQAIEEHYTQAMDVELLITKNLDDTHVIHLVQARPINRPIQNRKPDFIANVIDLPIDRILRAETIVAAGSFTRSIASPEQVIVASTLKEAENKYLFETTKKEAISAVIVEGEAEPNSHEATTFAGCGILVMCVRDHEQLRSFIEFGSFVLDPQQGAIVTTDGASVIVHEGFISHPMACHVTIEPAHATLSFDPKNYFPECNINILFARIKRSNEQEAVRSLSSLLYRLELEKNLLQQRAKEQEIRFVNDALEQLKALYAFAEKKACDALEFLKLPANDLKRLAAIKPIEALYFQEEDQELENSYSLQSILCKYRRRMSFFENDLSGKISPSARSMINSDPRLLDALCDGYDAALTPELKRRWLDFVQDNSQRLLQLSEMVHDLANLGALSAWMQIVFPNASSFDELYAEYKEAVGLLDQLKNLQIDLRNVSISDWERAEKFDLLSARVHDFLAILLSDEFLSVFDEPGTLKQIAALSFMGMFVDTFDDKFIKTLLCSNSYSSSEKVQNFQSMVKTYFTILKRWEPLSTLTDDAKSWDLADFLDDFKKWLPTLYSKIDKENFNGTEYINGAENFPEEVFEELPLINKEMLRMRYPSMSLKQAAILVTKERFNNVETFQKYIEKMKQGIEQTDLSHEQLFPPRDFSVASSIFVNVAKTGCPSNFDHYTLAAFFTLIHQNINSILTNLSLQAGLDQFQRPLLLQAIESKIHQLGFLLDESGHLKSPSLIGLNSNSTSLKLIYNLPIKQHGVTYDIIYNRHTSDVKLTINLVCVDNNLSTIARLFKMGANFLKAKNIATFSCEHDMRITCTLDHTSDVEHLDVFLQSLHELTSAFAKDPNNKNALQNTAQFMSLLEVTNKLEFQTILDEL